MDKLERRYRRVVDPTRRIVLVLDQAGYHTSPLVRVPEGLHLVFLPPDSPELQPVEHLWPFSDQPLVNQHFATSDELDELEDAVAQHCGQIQHQPEILRSAAHFHWLPAA